MDVLQSLKKAPTAKKLCDPQDAFIKRLECMMTKYSEGRVIIDRYIDQSLKNKTRQKRAAAFKEFKFHPETKPSMSLNELSVNLNNQEEHDNCTCWRVAETFL